MSNRPKKNQDPERETNQVTKNEPAENEASEKEEIMKDQDQPCNVTPPCENGMNCMGGEKKVPCETPFYPPIKDYEKKERSLESTFRRIFGHVVPERMQLLKEMREEGQRQKRELATEKAVQMTEDAHRPICPLDMKTAMEEAETHQAGRFNSNPSMLNAALLVATNRCKAIVLDGTVPCGDCPERLPRDDEKEVE